MEKTDNKTENKTNNLIWIENEIIETALASLPVTLRECADIRIIESQRFLDEYGKVGRETASPFAIVASEETASLLKKSYPTAFVDDNGFKARNVERKICWLFTHSDYKGSEEKTIHNWGTLQANALRALNDERTLVSIEIDSYPNNLFYISGERICIAGLSIILNYSEGEPEKITAGSENLSFSPSVASFANDSMSQIVTVYCTRGSVTRNCCFTIRKRMGKVDHDSAISIPMENLGVARVSKVERKLSFEIPVLKMNTAFHPISVSMILKTWVHVQDEENTECLMYLKNWLFSFDRRLKASGNVWTLENPDGSVREYIPDWSGIPVDSELESWITTSADGTRTIRHQDKTLETYSFFGNDCLLTGIYPYPSTPENPDTALATVIVRTSDGKPIYVLHGKDTEGRTGMASFSYDTNMRLVSISHSLIPTGPVTVVGYSGAFVQSVIMTDQSAGVTETILLSRDMECVTISDGSHQDETGGMLSHVFEIDENGLCIGYSMFLGNEMVKCLSIESDVSDFVKPDSMDILALFKESDGEIASFTQLNAGCECGLYKLILNNDPEESPSTPLRGIGIMSNSLEAERLESLFGSKCYRREPDSRIEIENWTGVSIVRDHYVNSIYALCGSDMKREILLTPSFLSMRGVCYASMWIMTDAKTKISVNNANESDNNSEGTTFSINAGFGSWQFVAVPLLNPMVEMTLTLRVHVNEEAGTAYVSDFRIWRYPEEMYPVPGTSYDSMRRPVATYAIDPVFGKLQKNVISYDWSTGLVSSVTKYVSEPLVTPVWTRISMSSFSYSRGLLSETRTYGTDSTSYYIEGCEYTNRVMTGKTETDGMRMTVIGSDTSNIGTVYGSLQSPDIDVTTMSSELGLPFGIQSGMYESAIGYETNGDLNSLESTNDIFSFENDAFGNTISVSVGGSEMYTMEYSERGFLTSITYTNGFGYYYSYDNHDRIENMTTPTGTTFTFSRNMRTATETVWVGGETICHKTEMRPSDNIIMRETSFYDGNSKFEREDLPLSGSGRTGQYRTRIFGSRSAYENVTIYADSLGRTERIKRMAGMPSETLEYDSLGRVIERSHGMGDARPIVEHVEYVDLGNGRTSSLVARETTHTGGFAVGTSIYSYFPNGKLSQVSGMDGVHVQYSYDSLGRLVSEADYVTRKWRHINYDPDGNITYVHDTSLNDLSSIGSRTYDYENANVQYGQNPSWHGQLKRINGRDIRYDALGNMTQIPEFGSNEIRISATWAGRMATSINGNQMEYDHLGRRIKKGSLVTIWDGNLPKLEFDESLGASSMTYYYTDDRGISGLRVAGTDYILRRNAFGDVVSIFNSSGTFMCKYSYDAWGKCSAYDYFGNPIPADADHIANKNPIRWRGYYYDVETGLYWLSSRYYDPEIGRFISPDSVDYLDPTSINGLNLYAYCNNDPVNLVDSFGHSPNPIAAWFSTILGLFNPLSTAIGVGAIVIAVCQGRWDEVVEDWNNGCFNLFNQDASIAINSKVFSFYCGEKVVRHSIPDSSSCQIFGSIFLNKCDKEIKTLNHEFGHGIQEKIIGCLYYSQIALPSFVSYLRDPYALDFNYYSQPWERTADFFGGVTRDSGYKNGSMLLAWFYLLFGYSTLIGGGNYVY